MLPSLHWAQLLRLPCHKCRRGNVKIRTQRISLLSQQAPFVRRPPACCWSEASQFGRNELPRPQSPSSSNRPPVLLLYAAASPQAIMGNRKLPTERLVSAPTKDQRQHTHNRRRGHTVKAADKQTTRPGDVTVRSADTLQVSPRGILICKYAGRAHLAPLCVTSPVHRHTHRAIGTFQTRALGAHAQTCVWCSGRMRPP